MRPNVSKKVNIQYPPQTGPYKVFVKDKGIWRDHDTARLQISVGNPRHTGDKFFALTEWAAARFDKAILIVSDTLQRHNIAIQHGISLDEAHNLSSLGGQRWLKENQAALDNLKPWQKVVTHWDDWMAHPDYAATRQEINDLYARLPVFQGIVAAKAESFCARQGDENSLAQHRDIQTSTAYLLEEIAAFAVMFKQTRAVDIYPGTWFKEVFETLAQSGEGSDRLSGFSDVACLSVDFTRNKAS